MFKRVLYSFLVFIALVVSGHAILAQEEITGRASAIAGDTLLIKSLDDGKKTKIRLWGIDAPEVTQHCETPNGRSVNCGVLARDALRSMLKRKELTCIDFEKGRKGQLTALCYIGDKILNGAIVRAGWALAFKQESSDYLELEKQARLKEKGIWKYTFTKPWVWRKNNKNKN